VFSRRVPIRALSRRPRSRLSERRRHLRRLPGIPVSAHESIATGRKRVAAALTRPNLASGLTGRNTTLAFVVKTTSTWTSTGNQYSDGCGGARGPSGDRGILLSPLPPVRPCTYGVPPHVAATVAPPPW
jgi:hypothetical protein